MRPMVRYAAGVLGLLLELCGNAAGHVQPDPSSDAGATSQRGNKEIQTMFYKAPLTEAQRKIALVSMWDVWLFYDSGTYWLYYLGATDQPGTNNNAYSMARSPDGVHWTDLGVVLQADVEAKAGETSYMGTGATWRNPVPGAKPAFQINFSNSRVIDTPAGLARDQTIFFAQSDDLIHWTKCGPQHEFLRDEHWYQPGGRWDSIWAIPRPGGGLYGYWTATPKPETGGQFGFGESLDGITWKALKPPEVHGGYSRTAFGEVGAIEKIGDRYVMLYAVNARMETIVADAPQGPFTAAAKNRVCLAGLPHTYFARFFPSPSGLLVCHHSIARDEQVYFPPLKSARVDEEGTLRLGWWKGNEKMKHQSVAIRQPVIARPPPSLAWIEKTFDAEAGVILEGTLRLPAAGEARRGIYIECDQRPGFATNLVSPASMWATHPLYTESNKGQGVAVLFDAQGAAELGTMNTDGADFKADIKVNREMTFGAPATFRLLFQGAMMEFYLDDILIECYSLPTPATGRVGLIPGNQPDSIGALKAWLAAESGDPVPEGRRNKPTALAAGTAVKPEDRSIVEVYVNGEALSQRFFADPQSLGVAAFAEEGPAALKALELWQMRSIYSNGSEPRGLPPSPPLAAKGENMTIDPAAGQVDPDQHTISNDVQAGFYTPGRTGGIWDNWACYHEGRYYLFYVGGPPGKDDPRIPVGFLKNWNSFGLATSDDGVHWKEYGTVAQCRPNTSMGSGHIWKSPDFARDHTWIMNYSEFFGEAEDYWSHVPNFRGQNIIFLTSTDLLHWTKVDESLRFGVDARWYKEKGRWDSMDVLPRPDGSLYAYFTAEPDPGKVDYKACYAVGFAESKDGLRWHALPPLPGETTGEVGGVEKIGRKYYMTIGAGEIFYADRPEGPFLRQKKNPNMLDKDCDAYYSRFFHTAPGGPLVNNFYWHGIAYTALFKAIDIDAEEILRLKWWKGNEKLKERKVPSALAADSAEPCFVRFLEPTLNLDAAWVIEASLTLPETDVPMGFYLDSGDGTGQVVLFGRQGTAFGTANLDGSGRSAGSTVTRDIDFAGEVNVRLVMKKDMIETYMNDYLMNTKRVTCKGRIGVIGPLTPQNVGSIEVWTEQ